DVAGVPPNLPKPSRAACSSRSWGSKSLRRGRRERTPGRAGIRTFAAPMATGADKTQAAQGDAREQLKLRKLSAEVERAEQLARIAFFDAEKRKRDHEWEEAADEQAGVHAFWHEVNRDTVFDAVRELSNWSRSNERKPLVFEINSPGGEVIHGLALY